MEFGTKLYMKKGEQLNYTGYNLYRRLSNSAPAIPLFFRPRRENVCEITRNSEAFHSMYFIGTIANAFGFFFFGFVFLFK